MSIIGIRGLPAVAALVLAAAPAMAQAPQTTVPGADTQSRRYESQTGAAADTGIVISGTVVSASGGTLVLRTDDHRHRMRFDLGTASGSNELRRGDRVSVRYQPTGATGQSVLEVKALGRSDAPVSQASFRPVLGSDTDVRRASSMDDTLNARGEGVRSAQADRDTEGPPARDRSGTDDAAASDPASRPAERESAGAATPDAAALPATASETPAMALAGAVMVALGLLLWRRRIAT
jgi:LPXTG-motif cell wall-anchored protein